IALGWHKWLGKSNTKNRRSFYQKVTDNSPLRGFDELVNVEESYKQTLEKEKAVDMALKKKVKELVETVCGMLRPEGGNNKSPCIIFSFDEAHTLTRAKKTADWDVASSRTPYQCLCKALTYFTATPVFGLFLSTFSRLSEFAPSSRNFWSFRGSQNGGDNMHAPFVELPFDLPIVKASKSTTAPESQRLVVEGKHSLKDMQSLKFMARFGRPL
ncbi:hypothetical protein H0H87_011168, partial [Tephrocybe sp. NHM501043]